MFLYFASLQVKDAATGTLRRSPRLSLDLRTALLPGLLGSGRLTQITKESKCFLDALTGVDRYVNFYNHQRRCAKAGGTSPIRYELSLARLKQAA